MVRARDGEKRRLMGRSQVVRQRILIPPFGGSSPPAPAMTQRAELLTKLAASRLTIASAPATRAPDINPIALARLARARLACPRPAWARLGWARLGPHRPMNCCRD